MKSAILLTVAGAIFLAAAEQSRPPSRAAVATAACQRANRDALEFPRYSADCPNVADVRGRATGFFRVEQMDDGRWWAMDPLGRGTAIFGVDHVRYGGFKSQRSGRSAYLESNRRQFPVRAAWETNTLARLKAWGFTMLGSGLDRSLERRGLAHARSIALSNVMCKDKPQELWICPYEHRPCSAFPNVFHPRFAALCELAAHEKCAPYRNDPWLFGYFIDNELAWWGRGARDTGLFDAVAQLPADHSAKVAQVQFLAERGVQGPCPAAIKLEFLRLAAERYFSIASAAIRKADPNHLVLGSRFAGITGAHPEVWRVAGKYCDVITLNCYPWADLDRNEVRLSRKPGSQRVADTLAELHAQTGRPLLITEWSFPALDSGLPCTHGAGQRFRTQALRVRASELFAKTLLALPFLIGYDYFMWVDEPPQGVSDAFPEDSNYGLVNERNEPYPALTAMFATLQNDVRTWRLASPPARRQPLLRKSLSADAVRDLLAAGDPATCRIEAGRYRVTNDAGLELEGHIGGKAVFDQVKACGTELGRFTGMLCDKAEGKLRWRDLSRVTSAEWRDGRLLVSGDGGKGSSCFAFAFAISPVAGKPWFLCELVSASNMGTEPLEVDSVLFRQYAPYAADKARGDSFRGVPNLWGSPNADAWFSLADGAVFGGHSGAPSVSYFKYYTSRDGRSQHPDAIFVPGSWLVLAPGETRDFNGTVWMVSIGAAHGGRVAWEDALGWLDGKTWWQ